MTLIKNRVLLNVFIFFILMTELICKSTTVRRKVRKKSSINKTIRSDDGIDEDETVLTDKDFENAKDIDPHDMKGFNSSLMDNEGAIEGDIMPGPKPNFAKRVKPKSERNF